ncbi:MAG: TRAP transporter large permease subunit [Rhodospirillales bacterium]
MELYFLALLIILMAVALGSGYPVAFALPGSAVIAIGAAALCGWLFADNPDAYFHQGGPVQWLTAGVTNFRGVYWEVERDTLIAIPLFIFMGIMLQRSKLAEDLLVTMAQMFGPVPGGLGISVIFVGALLAATTGIVGATVVAMGLISLPAMMRNKYANSVATGTIAASGTLGQIIPPSIVLIILADQLASAVDQASTARKALYKDVTGDLMMPAAFDITSTSAGEMFLGAFVPGLVLVGLYMAYIMIVAVVRPKMVPTVPYDGAYDRKFWGKVAVTLVPPLTLIFLVLGSIITGVATVNQAGAIGAAGATVMAGYRLYEGRRGAYWPGIIVLVSLVAIAVLVGTFQINIKNIHTQRDAIGLVLALGAVAFLLGALIWSGWRTYKVDNTLHDVMVDTAKTTSLVFIILIGAAMLTAAFRAFGGEELVRDFLTSLPGGFWAQFIIVMAVIFVLGFFLDFIEIAVVVVPIVAPILLMDPSANVTAVWLGVMIGLNIQTSFLTPPFGFALFYLRGVASSAVKTIQMYKGVVPFIGLQLLALVIVGMSPPLVNYLPSRLSLLSDTAPPPRNPALQHCIEEGLFEDYESLEPAVRESIATMRSIDTSYLPTEQQSALAEALEKAEKTFAMVGQIETAEQELAAFTQDYRPLHVEVRGIQARIAGKRDDLKKLETDIRRLPNEDAFAAQRRSMEDDIAGLKAEIEQLAGTIPDTWKAEHAAFVKLDKAVSLARNQYRRNVDNAYQPLAELSELISTADTLAALEEPAADLATVLSTGNSALGTEAVKAFVADLRAVPGTYDLAGTFDELRAAMSGDTFDTETTLGQLSEAVAAFRAELAWRRQAAQELGPALAAYEETIRYNIGLRIQPRLPRDTALDVASCLATPRDLTLSF